MLHLRGFVSAVLSVAVIALLAGGSATAVTLFDEDFNGYTSFPNGGGDPTNAGLPLISEGADEFWYGGRFEFPDDGQTHQDIAVQEIGEGVGTGPNQTPVGRVEDDAGILFNVSTSGFQDVTLSFDWRTFLASSTDIVRVGFTTMDLLGDFPVFDGDPGTTEDDDRFFDFFNDPSAGNGSSATAQAWWLANWTQVLNDNNGGGTFETVNFALPSNASSIWVALWLDNGESDFAKFDNILVEGTVIPEPSTALLLGGGLALLALRSRR